ncbi:MAG TPA: NADPH-dependent FMN reductase [Dongiaceae bacterium]|nr:NADPH-dependent FMN reductase [Dongiaceae bacterium]
MNEHFGVTDLMDAAPAWAYTYPMIVIISGTNRPGSNTRKVTTHVAAIYQKLGVATQVLDLAELPPELFAPTAYAEKPAGFKKFTDAILASDGVVIVTPEYNGGIPGILKYFIDMLPFPESFEQRPVCFTGLAMGIWGALRPVEQLQAIFGYRNAFIYPERVFMPGIGKLLDAQGQFVTGDIPKRLEAQATGFVSFVEKLRGKKLH